MLFYNLLFSTFFFGCECVDFNIHINVCVYVCVFRPPEMGVPPPGKAVLSMSSLSYGVIRVDTEEKLSVLTLQDVGQVMPGGQSAISALLL